ncbi:MAG TPA: hypothetical protein VEG60_26740, partial [Candidatus Binatia bacterium]|nr:hypothetical protein [Candidatus Binatia bacterium]
MNLFASMRAALILLGLAVVPVVCLSAESPAVSQKPEAGATAAKAEAESSPSLAEILTAMEALEAGHRRLRLLLAEDKRSPVLAAELDKIDQAFSGTRRLAGNVLNDMVGFHELTDLSLALRAAEQRLTAAIDELVAKANALDAGLDRVTAASEQTGRWMMTADQRNASSTLRERIQALIPRYEALSRELRARRDQAIEVLGRATQLRGAVSALRVEVSERRDQVTARLRADRSEPIWRVEAHPGEQSRVRQFFNAQIAQGFR